MNNDIGYPYHGYNLPSDEPDNHCCICGEIIPIGADYYDINEDWVCSDCVDDYIDAHYKCRRQC